MISHRSVGRAKDPLIASLTKARVAVLAIATCLSFSGCGSERQAAPAPELAARPTSGATSQNLEPSGFAELSERSPFGSKMPPGFEGLSWTHILREAEGKTVDWYLWGGDERINRWVRHYVADLAAGRYGIEVNVIPVADTAEAVAILLDEKAADRDEGGAIDLMWVNGENFRTLKDADVLYGPWTEAAPNSKYLDLSAPVNAMDFGVLVEGRELPWGRSHFVMIHDAARTPDAPGSLDELFDFARANPGKVTYPAPPDFTGSAFVRQVCIHTLGGSVALETLGDPSDPTVLAPCAERLAEIEPFLWREGETYPSSVAQLDDLFADGEVEFSMSFNPSAAARNIEDGRFPDTSRTFVFDHGTLANTHFLAIPYNASERAAAMVLANFLLSPEAQYAKAQRANWGDARVIEEALIEPIWAQTFADLPGHPATLPHEVLARNRMSEPSVEWIEAIEIMWERQVLAP